ncbi:MAG: hypothetical protein ABW100_08095 [Candidatus Thiodiazotropha sp. 6PLUC3]
MFTRSLIIAIFSVFLCSTPMLAETQILPPPSLNKAQKMFFYKDHLQGIGKGSQVDYGLKSTTTDDESFTDKIELKVTNVISERKRDIEFNFLTGSRHIDFSPAKSYTGNPVIIHFLERDISMMSRDTGGWNGYFRNRIRDSFKHPVHVKDVSIKYKGQDIKGTEIVITPFIGDPNSENFKLYVKKSYKFIFSDQVPGGVYRIHTQVPSENGEQVLIEEDMTFQKLTPGA